MGRHEQGIVNRVEVNTSRLKGKAGIQDDGEMTKQAKADLKGSDPTKKSKREKEVAFRAELAQWRTDPRQGKAARTKQPRYTYATVAEIAAAASAGSSVAAAGAAAATVQRGVKVVDMTGASPREFTGYENIKTAGGGAGAGERAAELPLVSGADGSIPMPELQANINLLVTRAEEDIRTISVKAKREKARRAALERERVTLSGRVANERVRLAELRKILDVVADCRARIATGSTNPLGLGECASMFAKIRKESADLYEMYGVASLAGSLMLPMIKSEFECWAPLADPHGRLNFYHTCKALLASPGESSVERTEPPSSSDELTIFERVCWDVVIPRFRDALLNHWEPVEYSP
jgi:hypothetical protein